MAEFEAAKLINKSLAHYTYHPPEPSEFIPLSEFPPAWWEALRKEDWAFDLIKDDLDF